MGKIYPALNRLNVTSTPNKKVYVKGKFLYQGSEKIYLKGVTYGTFAPQEDGTQYPGAEVVENDIRKMVKFGINCLRTYTVPPKHLLDIAFLYNIKVMVGLPWEQHITFLDSNSRKQAIINKLGADVSACGQHPAILCFAIGNEIPASIVRWYGNNKIESFLKQLYKTVKAVDPYTLVTYVNYPTTEYLNLSFLDFDCFNVYLETPEKLSAYIARLHNQAGDRPLILAEIGLDSYRNGLEKQSEILTWQIDTIFSKGCAGMFVFAWTDEWWRGGFAIEDWDFGLVDRERNPKPALLAVAQAMKAIPFADDNPLPFISVVICSYNGSATIRDSINGILKLDYPSYEVIVINDGSTDNLAAIVSEYPVQLISIPNGGLSNARNAGMRHSKGEIIAYIDDDAYPDPHWLRYLAYAYTHADHACIGGPNVVPDEDGMTAKCIANSPGGPVHVLITDEIAEHVPGCNMSFRKADLLKVGGFDPVYRTAGDDVDICWRIQAMGKTIGFHPAALVWHHRRNSIKTYWKQQKGYGRAEALLENKWPEKYNALGHLSWTGRVYSSGFTLPISFRKSRVFYGTWGGALFQSVYQPADGFFSAIPLMPEWYLVVAVMMGLGMLGFIWAPLLYMWLLAALCVLIVIVQAAISAKKNISSVAAKNKNLSTTLLITYLHIIQPLARLYGRISHGLTPWRKRGDYWNKDFLFVMRPKIFTHWSEEWTSNEDWLKHIESRLINLKTRVKRGGDFDQWDLEAKNGLFSTTKSLLAIEEHGAGKQLLRLRVTARPTKFCIFFLGLFTSITLIAFLQAQNNAFFFFICLTTVVIAVYINGVCTTFSHLFTAFKSLDKKVVNTNTEEMAGWEPSLTNDSIYLHPELINSKVIIRPQCDEIFTDQLLPI